MSLLGLLIFLILSIQFDEVCLEATDDAHGIRPPTACEVCKLFTHEFMLRFNATNSAELLDYHGTSNKKIPYSKSELRLTEILEDPALCSSMLKYRLHNERKDSTRFQKSRPQTFETLRELVDRGVDVKLDIPQELWDSPSLEITMLKEKCEKLVSEYENQIENWFFAHQGDTSLLNFLCRDQVLRNLPSGCLDEPMSSESNSDEAQEETAESSSDPVPEKSSEKVEKRPPDEL